MKELMNYLPENYAASPEMAALQAAIQPEISAVWAARRGMLQQTDPRTATEWGIALWEQAFGLTPDDSKDLDFRRSRVVAQIRGSGTVTAGHIKEVAESFSNGEVEVVEFFSGYHLEIRFVGTVGIPPNLDDLEAVLNSILPAHLSWEFVIYFRTHGELTSLTHTQLAAYTHTTIREGDLTDGN